MRQAGQIVAEVIERMKELVRPGVTTLELDLAAEEMIRRRGGRPAFKGYGPPVRPPFPGTICASVNDVVVHGIPGGQVLCEGDIVSIDVGVEHRGFFGDTAVTLPVGSVSKTARRLMKTCARALELAIDLARPGRALCQIGAAVQEHVESHGFSVVRDFVGHGIGTNLHQPPEVPNFRKAGAPDLTLEPGLVIAIEPMINAGTYKIKVDRDGWTARTADGRLSAHFEHTVAVTADEPNVLTLP